MDDLLKRKNLEGLFTFLAGHYPRYELVINNDVARQNGVSIADALENLLVIMGEDVQAEGTFERVAEDYSNRFVKNGRGEMVPYRLFLLLRNSSSLLDLPGESLNEYHEAGPSRFHEHAAWMLERSASARP